MEEREAQLEQQILNKYNQVKAMEKELQVLQFQAKQTTAPKKQGGLLLDRSTSCVRMNRCCRIKYMLRLPESVFVFAPWCHSALELIRRRIEECAHEVR